MEQAIRDRYTADILAQIQTRYGILPEDCRLLDGFESFIYEFDAPDQRSILRVGHSIRRPVKLVRGEIDWLTYLQQGGASVAKPLRSLTGNWIETVADEQGEEFVAVAFRRAPGRPPDRQRWKSPLFENYGRLLGQIHRLTRDYRPAEAVERPSWYDPIMLDVPRWLPPQDVSVERRFRQVVEEILELPKDRETYGLIHQDAHAGNFFVDDHGEITLFDFDDCVYSWFCFDIAMVLFYLLTNRIDPEGLVAEFWPHFYRGYCQQYRLPQGWSATIPLFHKLREIDLYAVIHRSFDVDDLGDAWVAGFMAGRREGIIEDRPYLPLDWSRLEL